MIQNTQESIIIKRKKVNGVKLERYDSWENAKKQRVKALTLKNVYIHTATQRQN